MKFWEFDYTQRNFYAEVSSHEILDLNEGVMRGVKRPKMGIISKFTRNRDF